MRSCVVAFIVLGFAAPAGAAVIVVANYTPGEVTFTLAEPDAKPRKHTLPAHHVLPFTVSGPADMLAPAEAKMPVRVEPYNAYVLIPDRETGVRVELLELPGQPPDR